MANPNFKFYYTVLNYIISKSTEINLIMQGDKSITFSYNQIIYDLYFELCSIILKKDLISQGESVIINCECDNIWH